MFETSAALFSQKGRYSGLFRFCRFHHQKTEFYAEGNRILVTKLDTVLYEYCDLSCVCACVCVRARVCARVEREREREIFRVLVVAAPPLFYLLSTW
jgi:hypothetical protein